MLVMYYNNANSCEPPQRWLDEIKKTYPNVRIFKVQTQNVPDIRDRYADGGSKPFFKFYKQGEKIDDVAYSGTWSV